MGSCYGRQIFLLSSPFVLLLVLCMAEGFIQTNSLQSCPQHMCLNAQNMDTVDDAPSVVSVNEKSDKLVKKRNKSQKKKTSMKTMPAVADKKNDTRKKTNKSKSKKTYKPRRPLKELKLGSYIEGKVVQLKPYGAFIQTKYDIKDKGWALLHISQIQHNRIDDINKILKVGQKIKPRVITIDYDTKEVGVSLRAQREARKPVSAMNVGEEVKGTIKSIEPYGAFVDIGCKSDALLHISRISVDKISNIKDHINTGDEVTVHLIAVDKKKKTLAASMLPEVNDEYLNRRKRYRERQEKKMLAGSES